MWFFKIRKIESQSIVSVYIRECSCNIRKVQVWRTFTSGKRRSQVSVNKRNLYANCRYLSHVHFKVYNYLMSFLRESQVSLTLSGVNRKLWWFCACPSATVCVKMKRTSFQTNQKMTFRVLIDFLPKTFRSLSIETCTTSCYLYF